MVSEIKVSTGINIAIIKYWGKKCEKLNLPLNSSLSITLNQNHLKTTTRIFFDSEIDEDKLYVNGKEELAAKNPRVAACLQSIREASRTGGWSKDERKVVITSENNFPTAAGLASSASGYAALVSSLARLYRLPSEIDLSPIARRGSGSATRSMRGGFVRWNAADDDEEEKSGAEQLFDHRHWPELRVFIAVVSARRKATPSTAGMRRSVETSALLAHRARTVVPERIKALQDAIAVRDFSKFARIAMADSNQLHAVCADTYPPIRYLTDTSYHIIDFVHACNRAHGAEMMAYTFDAGPNAFIFTLEKHAPKVAAALEHYFGPDQGAGDFLRGMRYDTSGLEGKLEGVDVEVRKGSVQFVICTDVGGDPVVESH